jgi:hypothetical protein
MFYYLCFILLYFDLNLNYIQLSFEYYSFLFLSDYVLTSVSASS